MNNRRVGLGLTLLLTMSLLAVPAAGQSDSDHSGEWRTLSPSADDLDRSNHTFVGTDVSAVLQRDTVRFDGIHRQQTLETERALASTDSARYDRLAAELGSIDDRIETLTERQKSLTERYGSKRIGGQTFLTGLATVGVHAKVLEERLVAIRIAGRELESRALVRRSNDHLARMQVLEGTVRSHVATTQRGGAERRRFYVETANRSVALATATGQDYLREVSLPEHRREGGTAIGLSRAVSIVAESYPEVYGARQRIEVGGSRRAGFYRIAIAGTGEFLTALVDADNRAVFREDRRVSLARMTLAPGPNTTQGEHRLLVEMTYRGGPMRVTVERLDGEPVDAQISLGDQVIGATGEDGHIWSTAPASTTVQAAVDGTTLVVPLETSSPPALNRTDG